MLMTMLPWSIDSVLFNCRCLGILVQKIDDKAFVRDKIDLMYKQANIAMPSNRLGLAKGMGLV